MLPSGSVIVSLKKPKAKSQKKITPTPNCYVTFYFAASTSISQWCIVGTFIPSIRRYNCKLVDPQKCPKKEITRKILKNQEFEKFVPNIGTSKLFT